MADSAPLPLIIPGPREPLIDQRTGAISRTWNLFLEQLRRNGTGVTNATVITSDSQTNAFPNSLVLTPVPGELVRLLSTNVFSLGLADAGTEGTSGSATETVAVTRDAKGRVLSVDVFTLNTDNITEGADNLFFTEDRARASVSASDGVDYDEPSGNFTLDQDFTRGLLSDGSGINYNSGTGVISTSGFTGDIVVGLQTLHFVDGILDSVT